MTRKTLCFDSKKCVGCYACTVACMDQNDIDIVGDGLMYRHIAHVESKLISFHEIHYVDMDNGKSFTLSNEIMHIVKDVTNIALLGDR